MKLKSSSSVALATCQCSVAIRGQFHTNQVSPGVPSDSAHLDGEMVKTLFLKLVCLCWAVAFQMLRRTRLAISHLSNHSPSRTQTKSLPQRLDQELPRLFFPSPSRRLGSKLAFSSLFPLEVAALTVTLRPCYCP